MVMGWTDVSYQQESCKYTHTHTQPSGRLEKNRESVNVNTAHVAALLDRFCVVVLFYSQ